MPKDSAHFVIKLQSHAFGSATYKNFGISLDKKGIVTVMTIGSTPNGGGSLQGNLQLQMDHWYVILLQVIPENNFYVRIWDKEDPTQFQDKTWQKGTEWANRSWSASINGNSGFLIIDSYKEIQIVE